jgi:hypothetical protein
MNSYPSFNPASEFGYTIGSYLEIVPHWLADTVMIRPFGEYGTSLTPVYTELGGGYWYNANSAADGVTVDLVYLVKNDLQLLSGVKKVILALHWYTSLDQGNVATNNIVPAIGPEVQAWNWDADHKPAEEYLVYPWTRANAYPLQPTHQVWPTLDDNALYFGFEYLQQAGYQVGLCPMVTLISRNSYYPNGGEWEVDRSLKIWKLADQANFTAYLTAYTNMYRHYIDLFSQSSDAIPWIIYLGYGMRDITGCNVPAFLVQFVQTLCALANYAKTKLVNTKLTYAADLDEYYYPYGVNSNLNNLDPLWTCPDLDYVGVNWFAPLSLNDTEDNKTLEQGVLQGEADTFSLSNFQWHGSTMDRLLSNTTENFKTGLTAQKINPLVNGVKEIIPWLSFYHYYPAINGVLAGCTPLPTMFPGNPQLCSHMHGFGPVASEDVLIPITGGIAPVPDLQATWAEVQLHSYMFVTLPILVPDNSVFNFEFSFSIDWSLTVTGGSYRLFDSSFGLKFDIINGTATLWVPTIVGSLHSVALFTVTSAVSTISLVYTASSVAISIDGAFDQTITPAQDSFFQLPNALDSFWLGNPQAGLMPPGVFAYGLPANYGVWQGKIYFLSIMLGDPAGAPSKQSGGQFYFDDSYAGIRTAWTPNLKDWMCTAFGYDSVHGSAVDPHSRAQTILATSSRLSAQYEDYANASAAVFRNGRKIWDIQGPYGSDFAIDDTYQAIVLNAAALGIIEAGAVHQVAWFFDTRSGSAYLALMPNNVQIFNDAYDYEINSALNGKAAVRSDGSSLLYVADTTVSQDLGLSAVPGPLPFEKVILQQPNVPQV